MDVFKSYTADQFRILPLEDQQLVLDLVTVEANMKINIMLINRYKDTIKEEEEKLIQLTGKFNSIQMKLNIKKVT